MYKIAIIGPECTGKTTLSQQLADRFNGICVAEYAREYVENLHRKYTYDDVEKISQIQFQQIKKIENENVNFSFFDTELIISKVWFEIVFKKQPEWLENAIIESKFDFYLLCNTDIPWKADRVRENGGIMRDKLYNIYKEELIHYKFRFAEISGVGNERLKNAINLINNLGEPSKS